MQGSLFLRVTKQDIPIGATLADSGETEESQYDKRVPGGVHNPIPDESGRHDDRRHNGERDGAP